MKPLVVRLMALFSIASTALAYGISGQSWGRDKVEELVFSENVAAAPLELVCPGAALALGGEDGTQADLIERLGTADLSLHVGDADSALATYPDSAALESKKLEGWNVIRLTDSKNEQSTELLSAAQLQRVSNARNRGLMGANCIQPELSFLFLGGSLAEGNETLLLLANPGDKEAGVRVRLITDTGASEEDYSVLGLEERIIPLGSLGEGETSIAVEVTATQPVFAYLQHRASAGLEPLGISWVSPQSESSAVQLLSGLVVLGSAEAATKELVSPVVRILNPGTEDVEALIEVAGQESFGAVERLSIPAERVREVALDGLGDGDYFVKISTDSPIYASAKAPLVLDSGSTDFDWIAPVTTFDKALRFPAPSAKATLFLTNPLDQPISIELELGPSATPASSKTLSIAAKSQQAVKIDIGQSIKLATDNETGFSASLRFLNGSGLAYWLPSENQNLGSEITIRIR